MTPFYITNHFPLNFKVKQQLKQTIGKYNKATKIILMILKLHIFNIQTFPQIIPLKKSIIPHPHLHNLT